MACYLGVGCVWKGPRILTLFPLREIKESMISTLRPVKMTRRCSLLCRLSSSSCGERSHWDSPWIESLFLVELFNFLVSVDNNSNIHCILLHFNFIILILQ